MYDIKELYEAESLEHAIRLRVEHPEAHIIAGGSDVLIQIREGKRAGVELISIYTLDELRGVSLDENGAIRIGSLSALVPNGLVGSGFSTNSAFRFGWSRAVHSL